MESGTCLVGVVAFLDEIVDSSDEEETDGKYTFGLSKLYSELLSVITKIWNAEQSNCLLTIIVNNTEINDFSLMFYKLFQ